MVKSIGVKGVNLPVCLKVPPSMVTVVAVAVVVLCHPSEIRHKLFLYAGQFFMLLLSSADFFSKITISKSSGPTVGHPDMGPNHKSGNVMITKQNRTSHISRRYKSRRCQSHK